MTALSEVDLVLKIVNAAGTVGLLVFMVIAFYTGRIVPRQVVDDIVKTAVTEIIESFKQDQKEHKTGW